MLGAPAGDEDVRVMAGAVPDCRCPVQIFTVSGLPGAQLWTENGSRDSASQRVEMTISPDSVTRVRLWSVRDRGLAGLLHLQSRVPALRRGEVQRLGLRRLAVEQLSKQVDDGHETALVKNESRPQALRH